MPLSSYIYKSLSEAKEKISTKAQEFRDSYFVQATWQGLTAPFYSRNELQAVINNSEDVRETLDRSWKINRNYAATAFFSYVVYYRLVQPHFENYYEDHDSNSLVDNASSLGVSVVDNSLYAFMVLYLTSVWLNNILQNYSLVSSITYAAARDVPESKDFQPCSCASTEVIKHEGSSLVFYAGSRYLVNKLSRPVMSLMPGWEGKLLAFSMEAASFGPALVEYKFSASGKCWEHRFKEMVSRHKAYCFMYGASFVGATWGSYRALTALSGVDNDYLYDAVFSFMFQFYVLLAIVRNKSFPGNPRVRYDILGALVKLTQTPLFQFLSNSFFGELASLEKAVQSPGVSLWLLVREDQIRSNLVLVREKLDYTDQIRSSKLVKVGKFIDKLLPFQVVPKEIKDIFKAMGPAKIEKICIRVETLLELAKVAEADRNAKKKFARIKQVENHYKVPLDVKNHQISINPQTAEEEKKIILPKVKSSELLSRVPSVKKVKVNNDHFTGVSKQSNARVASTNLWERNKPKQSEIEEDNLADLTASIISSAAMS